MFELASAWIKADNHLIYNTYYYYVNMTLTKSLYLKVDNVLKLHALKEWLLGGSICQRRHFPLHPLPSQKALK